MTTATVTSASDLAATIPSLLGFAPEESAVLVFEKNGAIMCTARADLDPAQVSATVTHLADHEPTSVSLVIYTNQPATVASELVERLEAVIPATLACHSGFVRAGIYQGGGLPPVRLDHTPAAVAALATEGVTVAPSRREAMELVPAVQPDQEVAVQLADATIPESVEERRQVEDAVVTYLTSDAATPDAATVAMWLAAMQASEIREPVLKRLADHGPGARDHAARMLGLVQQAPRIDATASATATAAALMWMTGDCARAAALAQEASRAHAGNVLAQLVAQACKNGVEPHVFTDMLAEMDLNALRKI